MSAEEVIDEYGRGMVGSFIQFAHRFDAMSESVLNQYMCTDVCPCLDYDSMGQGSKNLFITNPKINLPSYNRTTSPTDAARKYLNFTSERQVGFYSFDECYNYYNNKSKYKEGLPPEQIFKVDIGDLKAHLPEEILEDHSDGVRNNIGFILRHFDEMAMYESLEDEYMCSGMCNPSLFYFKRPLHEGPPQETCLYKFKHVMH